MIPLITSVTQAAPEWLTETLHLAGVLTHGEVTRVESDASERSAATTAHLSLSYSPDAPADAPRKLFLKLGGRPTESLFHREIAPAMPDGPLLRCYLAQYDAPSDTQILLLQDISETHYAAPEIVSPTRAECERMMATAAEFHAFWWEHPRLSGDIGEQNAQIGNDAFILRQTQETFPRFVDFMGERLSAKRRQLYEKVLSSMPLPMLTKRLNSRQQVTLIHGDSHAQNYMLPRDAGRVYLIDCADWRIQIPMADIAFLIALEFYPELRRRIEKPLVEYYHERLLEHGIQGYTWDQCWLDYRLATFQCLLMPIFWYSWSPPKFWWHSLEKVINAFEDLYYEELLS